MLALAVCGCGSSSHAGPKGHIEAGAGFAQGGPEQLVFDGAGNLYGVDCQDSWVFRVDRNRELWIVGGTGNQGHSGDGGPAVHADFTCPAGVAIDRAGNVYVADRGANRVRRIDVGGTVHAFAGAGPLPPLDSNAGAFGGDGGPALRARLRAPVNLAFDGRGNLYFADRENGAVREIRRDGTIVTVAGSGVRGYSGDGGPATKAKLDRPRGIAFDPAGRMYIADSANNRIRVVDRRGMITTFVHLRDPDALAFDRHGNLYVALPDENVVRRIDRHGTISTVAAGALAAPFALAFDGRGNLYIGDHDNGRILMLDRRGAVTTYFDGRLGNP